MNKESGYEGINVSALPGYDAISLGEGFRFQRIMLSSSSRVCVLNLLGMLTLEHGGNGILRKVCEHLSNDTAPYPKRRYSPGAPLPELQKSRFMYYYLKNLEASSSS